VAAVKKRVLKVKEEARTGERIVRAWFDTVINPLLQGLKVEEARLQQRNWTWQYRLGRLESIRRIEEMVPRLAIDNLEQFLSHNALLKAGFRLHDEQRMQLQVACQKLQSKIESSPELQVKYQHATSNHSLEELDVHLDQLFSNVPLNERLSLLAEYIINETPELPSYFTLSPLWNTSREEFVGILDLPTIRPYAYQTKRTGETLLRTVDRLIKLLKVRREQLSTKYDLPYVTADILHAD
jgi:hypothetical protein